MLLKLETCLKIDFLPKRNRYREVNLGNEQEVLILFTWSSGIKTTFHTKFIKSKYILIINIKILIIIVI